MAQALQALMDRRGIKGANELARQMKERDPRWKTSQSTISRILRADGGPPTSPTVRAIAAFFEVEPAVVRGEVALPDALDHAMRIHNAQQTSASYAATRLDVRRVPVIKSSSAAAWSSMTSDERIAAATGWVVSHVLCSPLTFAVRVSGDSMHNPFEEPSLRDGEIAVVDATADPTRSRVVLVQLSDASEPVFRQLREEGGKRYLRATNPNWPADQRIVPLPLDAKILGVVVFAGREM